MALAQGHGDTEINEVTSRINFNAPLLKDGITRRVL